MQQKISFVITTRDESAPVLESTIDGLLATSARYAREIVVVDDKSATPVSLDRPDTLVVRHDAPVGVTQSRRRGASVASGDVLVWLDAHMSFAPDWLDHMLAHVDSGALLCAAWWDYELTKPLCWGADFLWRAERNYSLAHCPGFDFRHRVQFPGEGAIEVPMVIGACYMMLRESYERIGGFSPFFRTWGKDEQDISARAWMAGLGVKCVTGARVGHLSRSKFPYPVHFEEIEFNQLAMVRSVFEPETASAIEELLKPLPQRVKEWLDQTDFSAWRSVVQSARKISDAEFFSRFLPQLPNAVKSRKQKAPAVMSALKEKISFIIATRNEAAAVLEATVDGVLATSERYAREIVVVDDASLVPVSLARPDVRLVRHDEAMGIARSRRHGAEMTSGEVLVWLDAHMSFASDWLDCMLAHVDCGSLLCAAFWNYELTRALCWGADFVWHTERNYAKNRSPGFALRHRTQPPGDGAVEVPVDIGACCMMLRASHEKMGGFSPFFRVWGTNEQDLSARAWLTGFGVKCVTNARVGQVTRSKFPYPVSWEDIEFDRFAMVRTVFEEKTVAALEEMMSPVPRKVQVWLDQTDFSAWRSLVQSNRQMSDAEFFRRFVPDAPSCLMRE
jgi:glycosyltransferase involved in cell wall biosynthesis